MTTEEGIQRSRIGHFVFADEGKTQATHSLLFWAATQPFSTFKMLPNVLCDVGKFKANYVYSPSPWSKLIYTLQYMTRENHKEMTRFWRVLDCGFIDKEQVFYMILRWQLHL